MTNKNPPATAPKTDANPTPKDKNGELSETDLNKVTGGMVTGGVKVTEDPCQGGQLHRA